MIKNIIKYVVFILAGLIITFIIIDTLFPIKIKEDYSQVILASDGSMLHAFLNKDDKWRMKIELEEINPLLKKTIIYKEDKFFRYHLGINPFAVFRALLKNTIRGERVSGASTITMQLARLMEPKERTYINKMIEMFRALQLEMHYSKDEIFQMYLNRISYGSNIEGIKSASVLYLQQMPKNLSLAQIVTLAIIPNRPTSLQLGKNNSYILQERNRWLEYLRKKSRFTNEEINDALAEPLEAFRHEAPKLTPHFALQLKQRYPQHTTINTFINPELQENVKNMAFDHIRPLKSMNISNAAVIVINNRKNCIEAYIGSADFFDNTHQGQVDGAIAVRSPGSTLKPFLYALAIDKGLITPNYVVNDIPINYSGYSPDNYDGKYRGPVTIHDALSLSLNVPAVNILNELGVDYFIKRLSEAGLTAIKDNAEKLGLSAVLGGCGVTLAELTRLYKGFANGGVYTETRWIEADSIMYYDTLLSQAASYMITEILRSVKRPDMPSKYDGSLNLPKIAWKTGTSYGRRDAWSIGYNKNYTVGVWVGNFPGHGVPELNGAYYAAPLLFKIFNILTRKSQDDWFIQPEGIDYRLVCSESGLPPSDFCDNLVMDAYIPGVSQMQKCQHMKPVFLNPDRTISYCRSCLPTTGYRKEMMQNLAPELISFYIENNIPFTSIPPHNPKCSRVFEEYAPIITSLNEGVEYILIKNETRKLKLKSSVENDVKTVFWYINDEFLTSVPASQNAFFQPEEGDIKISCTDDKGRNTNIWIKVTIL